MQKMAAFKEVSFFFFRVFFAFGLGMNDRQQQGASYS